MHTDSLAVVHPHQDGNETTTTTTTTAMDQSLLSHKIEPAVASPSSTRVIRPSYIDQDGRLRVPDPLNTDIIFTRKIQKDGTHYKVVPLNQWHGNHQFHRSIQSFQTVIHTNKHHYQTEIGQKLVGNCERVLSLARINNARFLSRHENQTEDWVEMTDTEIGGYLLQELSGGELQSPLLKTTPKEQGNQRNLHKMYLWNVSSRDAWEKQKQMFRTKISKKRKIKTNPTVSPIVVRVAQYNNKPEATENTKSKTSEPQETKKKRKPRKKGTHQLKNLIPVESDDKDVGRGVTMRPSGKWQAQFYFSGKSRYIGVFESKKEAFLAYEVVYQMLLPFRKKVLNLPDMTRHLEMARKVAFDEVDKLRARERSLSPVLSQDGTSQH